MAIVVAIIKFKLLYKSSLNLMEAAVGFLLSIQIKDRLPHLKSLNNYYYEEAFQCCRLFIISLQNRYLRGKHIFITSQHHNVSREEILIESFSGGHSPSLFRLMNAYSGDKFLLYLLKNLEHNLLSEHFWGSE